MNFRKNFFQKKIDEGIFKEYAKCGRNLSKTAELELEIPKGI